MMHDSMRLMAGAKGLEPSTSAVTGQRLRAGSAGFSKIDSTPALGNNGPKPRRFDSESNQPEPSTGGAAASEPGLTDYIAHNYGRCLLEPCHCRVAKILWPGVACLHWQPSKAISWEQLAIEQRAAVAVRP